MNDDDKNEAIDFRPKTTNQNGIENQHREYRHRFISLVAYGVRATVRVHLASLKGGTQFFRSACCRLLDGICNNVWV